MNRKGNLMINLLFFFMGLAVLVIFVSPIKSFLGFSQASNSLNCPGYIDDNANAIQNFSYNSSKSSSSLTCMVTTLFLPYIFIAFLIAGVSKLLYDRGGDIFGIAETQPGYQ